MGVKLDKIKNFHPDTDARAAGNKVFYLCSFNCYIDKWVVKIENRKRMVSNCARCSFRVSNLALST